MADQLQGEGTEGLKRPQVSGLSEVGRGGLTATVGAAGAGLGPLSDVPSVLGGGERVGVTVSA